MVPQLSPIVVVFFSLGVQEYPDGNNDSPESTKECHWITKQYHGNPDQKCPLDCVGHATKHITKHLQSTSRFYMAGKLPKTAKNQNNQSINTINNVYIPESDTIKHSSLKIRH